MRKVVLLLIMLSAVLAFGCKEEKKSGEKWVEKTETFYAVADAYVSETLSSSNFGNLTMCSAGYNGGYEAATLIKWDLSSIPSNAEIVEARVELNITARSSGVDSCKFGVYRLYTDWDESTVTYDDYVNVIYSLIDTFYGPSTTGPCEICSSQSLISVVKEWVQDPSTNFGLSIEPKWFSPPDEYINFSSREGGVAPKLVVKYRYKQ